MFVPIGPTDALQQPRFANSSTFARLPALSDVEDAEIVIMGVPFDSGVSYRPGARFGPTAIRQGSKLLRPYHPPLDVEPFNVVQVADAGDVTVNPFDILETLDNVERAADGHFTRNRRLLTLGGDHTIALPLLRAAHRRYGPIALVHFDAHLDTWDTYFGAPYTHGTPFRRAFEEGLLAENACMHVGTRGPLYARTDLEEDRGFGFALITTDRFSEIGPRAVGEEILRRVGERPLYISIDVDVMDPGFAPGTGTPEAGGLSSRELLQALRATRGAHLIGGDVVEVAPAYDHAEITSIAAAHVAYELLALMVAPATGA
jgi:agmatinase